MKASILGGKGNHVHGERELLSRGYLQYTYRHAIKDRDACMFWHAPYMWVESTDFEHQPTLPSPTKRESLSQWIRSELYCYRRLRLSVSDGAGWSSCEPIRVMSFRLVFGWFREPPASYHIS